MYIHTTAISTVTEDRRYVTTVRKKHRQIGTFMLGTAARGSGSVLSLVLILADVVLLSLLGFLPALVLLQLQLIQAFSLLIMSLDDSLLILRTSVCKELDFLLCQYGKGKLKPSEIICNYSGCAHHCDILREDVSQQVAVLIHSVQTSTTSSFFAIEQSYAKDDPGQFHELSGFLFVT